MHTNFSDGWPTPFDLVAHARVTGLDVIAVTDHDTIEGALRACDHAAGRSKLEVIVGEEVSSRNGHIVGLFLERRVRPGMSAAATVHAIHDQGGLAIAVHPFWRTHEPCWCLLRVELLSRASASSPSHTSPTPSPAPA